MKNYRTIFWSLQFHGRIFFSRLYVDVKRIWQPTDGVICMRWTVHGIPRVPWEAEGTFDGISTYRLDNNGKIYEHSVDNVSVCFMHVHVELGALSCLGCVCASLMSVAWSAHHAALRSQA